MNFYTQGVQAALEKLGAVPFTGQEAQYFQEMLKARGVAPTQTMTAQPAMAYRQTAPAGVPGVPGAETAVRPMEIPAGEKTLSGTAPGLEIGTQAGGAKPVRLQRMEALRSRLERVPGGGRQLGATATPAIGRQLGVPLHRTAIIENFMGPLARMEQPGVNIARQMGKAEGAKALGLGERALKALRFLK
jgi:hypothetical protein